jgi:hypothetical protein
MIKSFHGGTVCGSRLARDDKGDFCLTLTVEVRPGVIQEWNLLLTPGKKTQLTEQFNLFSVDSSFLQEDLWRIDLDYLDI